MIHSRVSMDSPRHHDMLGENKIRKGVGKGNKTRDINHK
uniref:Uncharacterized protein n=1 Tax=Rhizophora mucronata TaxID=61149 RepID=A0A2P2IU38_RHIMU